MGIEPSTHSNKTSLEKVGNGVIGYKILTWKRGQWRALWIRYPIHSTNFSSL